MSNRLLLGVFIAAALSGCFDGSGQSTVTNGSAGTSSTVSGAITSTPTATAPAVTPLIVSGVPAAGVIAGSEYSFTPVVSAATGAVTFAVSGLPSWATFDSSTGTLSGTPSTAAVGNTGDITITATDGTSTGSVGPFVIRVAPETSPVGGESPPLISGTPVTAVTSGQAYTFQPTAVDAAGNPLTFAISNCPVWATFSTATGQLTGTPTAAQAGTYSSITIRVTDGTLSATLTPFTIVVTAATPDMPVIKGTPGATVVAGLPYSFQPTAADPAGKALTFSITHPPVWATFSPTTGKLSGTPSITQVGPYSAIVISVDNGTQMTSLPAFAIQVTPAPTADSPSISGSPGLTDTAGKAYAFTPTARDPAGRTLSFSIVNRPTWATFNPATGTLSGTPSAAQAGNYPGIVIAATAGSARASLPAFDILVSTPAPPAAPTISGSPAGSVVADTAYSFTPSHTDPSNQTLVFSIANAPAWASFDTTTGRLSGTPSASNVGMTSGITITVSDGTSHATLPAFSIVVTEPPATSGSATLNWVAPTTNTDGTRLTNLSGYRIHYGSSVSAMTQTVQITNPAELTYTLTNLSAGTWYFEIVAYNSVDVDSSDSGVVSKEIP